METSSSSQPSSRWQEFRQANRNRPLKQIRILVSIMLATALYGYTLLGFQPQYSVESVVEYNTKVHTVLEKRQLEQQEKARQMRQRRVEQTNLRIQEQQKKRAAALLHHLNSTHASLEANNNNTKTTISVTKHPPVSEWVVFFRFLSTLFFTFGVWGLARLLLRFFVPQWNTTTGTSMFQPAAARVSRPTTRREQRQAAFRAWAARLNRQRAQQGERPLSLESLRLVLRNRDLSGNDYEQLLQFDEEAGPAMQALLQSMGMTQDEIDRCPHRVLQDGDDLLMNTMAQPQQHEMGSSSSAATSASSRPPPHCAVCLEQYELHDEVRTIPCFHTFHTRCIDPWLARKALCPICKHPAVA